MPPPGLQRKLKFMEITNEYVKIVSERMNHANFSIALDWLSFYFKHQGFFSNTLVEGQTQVLNNDCYLLALDKPTPHFDKHVIVIYKKTEVAHILFESRNEKFFKKDLCKVEFVNHTLYSGIWMEIYNLLIAHGLVYHAASRIDIAIDGVGYLQQLMNIYAKQTLSNKVTRLKNSSTIRARFSAKVLNPETMDFENFTVGSGTGNKMITIYNKSLEILKSGKMYIQDYWLANGVINNLVDYGSKAKEIEIKEKNGIDVVALNSGSDVYRFEIRMKSEAVKEIENFTPEMLMRKGGLASIVKLHCKNYFELSYMDDVNISRCTPIALLPYERLDAELINKIERVEKDGEYKAKMTIHGIVSDIYSGRVQSSNFNESVEMIIDRVMSYSLAEYLDRKLLEWDNKYRPLIDGERINDVILIIAQIKNRNGQLMESVSDMAERNNQAFATSYFGDS